MLLLFSIDCLGFFEGINSFFYDLSFRIRGSRHTDSRIVIAAIDEKTLKKLGRWPIKRAYYADLLDRTREATVVGLDIIMAEPSEDDPLLARAIQRHGRVVLPVYVSASRLSVMYPADTLRTAETGHIHIEPGIDGIVRKVFHSIYLDNSTLPSLASVIYESVTGKKYFRRQLSPESREQISTGTIVQADLMGINYYGAPASFRCISFGDIIAGTYPPHFFKDKVILAGITAAGLPDRLLTPFSQQRNTMPAVELQATVINNLLDGNDIRECPVWATRLLAVLLFGLCFALLMKHVGRSAVSAWLLSLSLVSMAVFGSFSLFNIWAEPALPCVSVTFACAVSHLFRLDKMAMKLDREYAEIASRLGWDPIRDDDLMPLPGFISSKGISKKIEMFVRIVKELLKTYQELETETAERIRAMDELRMKDQVLIQQSRMAAMGEMLGNISHQWRQPLNVLGLTIQHIKLSWEFGEFSKELLDANIAKAMDILLHLSQTIDDFRDFSSPDKKKSLFKVDQIIAKTISLMEESFKEQHIIMDVGTTGEPEINGYPNEFGHVLLNILMNARDALLEKGTGEARLTVRTRTENGKAVVTITDNAGGIREDIIGNIFDAYFTTKELGKGTGVGLFISKTIIEKNMGGSLTVRNVEGGAEFRIEV